MNLTPLMAALALALSASAAHAVADGNCAIVLNTPDGFLNLRSAPMVGSDVIARLRPGDLLYINSAECETKGSLSICNKDWTSVDAVARLDGTDFSKPGLRGWVYSRYLRSAGECPEPATSKRITAASVLAHSTTDPTLWHHNGSVVQLVAKRLSREFYYQEPRAGMLEAGAQVGSLLFQGHTKNGWYSGTAFIFDRHCGQFPYEVSGPILDNYTRVELTGQAPRIGPNCGVEGHWTDTLEFTLLKSGAAAKLGSADRNRPDSSRFFSAHLPGTANTESKTKLPEAFLGEWCFDTKTETYRRARCRQSDGWLTVWPAGFSAHETDCTLHSASPNRGGEYRTQFECRGEGMIWTAYYWIGLDARDQRRLFLNETDSTFTKTEPDPSERNERSH